MADNSKNTSQSKKQKQPLKQKLIPVSISLIAILLDQISKSLVVQNIGLLTDPATDKVQMIPILGNFLRLIHVRNKAVAFSFGSSLPQDARSVLFAFLPLIVIAIVFIIYFRSNDFTKLQRWAICGILGGGLGNLVDRFFRQPLGVVDFIDCAFWGNFFRNHGYKGNGILGWERWPTYNIADAFVVVCGGLLILSFIVISVREKKQQKKAEENN